ncbi:COG4223 family protein [Bradyrhizobium sp. HKCCYLS2038]|uniref:COG4223 family protein n=1 Tax=unclassified Bradyrhizobium TaxID=2631580 RepID=UPI003EB7B2CA
MVDEPDTAAPASETGRPKRPPPTIDLEPTSREERPSAAESAAERPTASPWSAPAEAVAEGSSGTASQSHPHGAADAEPELAPKETDAETVAAAEPPRAELPPPPPPRPVSPWIIAPFSGAAAAALVIGVGSMLGWPQVTPPSAVSPEAAAVDALSSRITTLEQRIGKPDAAMAGRIDAVDKAIAAVRGDVGALRSQSDKTIAALNDVKAQPRDGAAPQPAPEPVDLSGLTARIDALERTAKSQSAALAQESRKITEAAAAAEAAKSADDAPLRRVVAATLLDVAVRHGDPYGAALSTAKSLAGDAAALKPLETFAASGVPSPAALSRDLLTIVPKLTPPAPEGTTGTSIVDKLSAGAARLVKVERTDGAGTDRGAAVARITSAALRNDVAEARRELKAMSPEDRAPANDWLAKADARDAALSTARKFADDAMTALAKPAQ